MLVGWRYKKLKVVGLCFSMSAASCYSQYAHAAQTSKQTDAQISGSFLEYLAELVEVDGKLIHPTELSAKQSDINVKDAPNCKDKDELSTNKEPCSNVNKLKSEPTQSDQKSQYMKKEHK